MIEQRPPSQSRSTRVQARGKRRATKPDRQDRQRLEVAPARGGARARRPGYRRAAGLVGTLGMTFLGAILPGAGLWWSGRRKLGLLILLPALAILGSGLWYVGRSREAAVDFAFATDQLRVAAVVLLAGLVVWLGIVLMTYSVVRTRFRDRRPWQTFVGHGFLVVVCLVLGAPFAMAARYALVQADFVETVLDDSTSATAPKDVSEDNPWGDRKRVNVLLLGGDGGKDRTGVRTDSVILVSMDTRTGNATTFSLPRNMMNAQFPADSPLRDIYPDGYSGSDDDGFYMLNAVYGQIPARHPGILGKSDDEGADAIKQAVAGSLGIRVDYYLLVNLRGFEQVVDAMGGVTVNINEPVAIEGNTDAGIPPVDYLQPGPDQHLDGYHALWFSRGRYGSDDYARMERQRCMISALVEAAEPTTLIRRYQSLASAGKKILSTDIPREVAPSFVDLLLQVKDNDLRSVVFKTSAKFNSGNPDFEWMKETVDAALDPPKRKRDAPSASPSASPSESASESPSSDSSPSESASATPDPGAAVEAQDSCAYNPVAAD